METTNNNNVEDVVEIDLLEVFWLLLGKLWLLVLAAIIFGIAGYAYSSYTTVTKYKSTTSMYIRSNDETDSTTYSDTQLAGVLANDYVTLITSRTVLQAAIDAYELDVTYEQLYSMVTVSNETSTRIVEIYVTCTHPYKAQLYANAIREVAMDYIIDVTGAGAITTVEEADLPTTPVANSIRKITLIAAALGFILVAGIIVLINLLDDTIKTSDDVERYLGLSTLASIPVSEEASEQPRSKKKKSKPNQKVIDLGK